MLFKSVVTLLFSVFACTLSWASGQCVDEYVDYSVSGLPGRLYEPAASFTGTEKYPLVLALHGGGGIGSDNTRNVVDFDEFFDGAQRYHAFIYAPQATSAFWHIDERHQSIMTMIDKLVEEKNVDPDRIYITGFSMGGGGTWDLLKLYPDRFAAALPICSIAPRITSPVSGIAGKPIWAFHARDDLVVSVTDTRDVIDEILDAEDLPQPEYPSTGLFEFEEPSLNLKYTEYAIGGHAIWPHTYANEEVIDWLFSKKKGGPESPPQVLNTEVEANSKVSIVFRSVPGRQIEIERSSNLIDWLPLETVIGGPKTTTYITEEIGYYRLKLSSSEW
ncbi:prolyl oligopeptidase family serine peptidase [Puniceicoccaceae bacterium K14]|nr:prolyl oligopeptidase family serine peptidase [Puniceicoccaceae bacterium K14]